MDFCYIIDRFWKVECFFQSQEVVYDSFPVGVSIEEINQKVL